MSQNVCFSLADDVATNDKFDQVRITIQVFLSLNFRTCEVVLNQHGQDFKVNSSI
jgi:hypothetical protein